MAKKSVVTFLMALTLLLISSQQSVYADYFLPDGSGKVEYVGPGNLVKVINATSKSEVLVEGVRQSNNRIYLPEINKFFPEIKKQLDQYLGDQNSIPSSIGDFYTNTYTSIPIKSEQNELIGYASIYTKNDETMAVVESAANRGRSVKEVYGYENVSWKGNNEYSRWIQVANYHTSINSQNFREYMAFLMDFVKEVPSFSKTVSAEVQTDIAGFYIECNRNFTYTGYE